MLFPLSSDVALCIAERLFFSSPRPDSAQPESYRIRLIHKPPSSLLRPSQHRALVIDVMSRPLAPGSPPSIFELLPPQLRRFGVAPFAFVYGVLRQVFTPPPNSELPSDKHFSRTATRNPLFHRDPRFARRPESTLLLLPLTSSVLYSMAEPFAVRVREHSSPRTRFPFMPLVSSSSGTPHRDYPQHI